MTKTMMAVMKNASDDVDTYFSEPVRRKNAPLTSSPKSQAQPPIAGQRSPQGVGGVLA